MFFGQSNFNSRNSCNNERRLHSNPFITKKQLKPSMFGNTNYKVTVSPVFVFRTLQQMLCGVNLSAARLFFTYLFLFILFKDSP